MIIVAFVAIQVALVASEPTVLLQNHGDWAGESQSSMEFALANFVGKVVTQDDPAPALMNLLKSVTKKNVNGEEYLELKPLVTILMDTGRALAKHYGEVMTPKITMAAEHVFFKGPEMAVGHTLDLIDELFLEKGENSEIMDVALAVRVQQAAGALQKAVTTVLPVLMSFGDNAEALLDLAKLSMGAFGGEQNMVKFEAFSANLKSARQMVKTSSEEMMNRLRFLAQSSIKDNASREKALKRKSKVIAAMIPSVVRYADKMKAIVTYYKDNLNSVSDAFFGMEPPSPLAEKVHAYLSERLEALERQGHRKIANSIEEFTCELDARSKTLM